ncbi:MAG TPA: HPr(Ser) kinase/phosphatase [Verrucomicrobiota bacterium]|jgi:HPr kinase/phosphorylase|nr:HPr(Ser) kinase/phosphatase [Verrucomicrobiota bacterium]
MATKRKPKREKITTERFFREQAEPLQMRLVAGGEGLGRTIIEPTVNRPGLALAGFTKYIAFKRIQVIGNAEAFYLKSLPMRERVKRYKKICSYKIPCIVFTRNLHIDRELKSIANEISMPIFQTPMVTMRFVNLATIELDLLFAPRETILGSMVDVHGVGVLIQGESGIGKSETVLELIERGYSLVSDDVTRMTLLDGREIVGTSSELARNHMEVRGIGIINVAAMFGAKSVRTEKRLDLVVSLKVWRDAKDIDRLGMDEEFLKIIGIKVRKISIPVRPGRNLARLIEVAALSTKLSASGYNPARELNDRLIATMASGKPS